MAFNDSGGSSAVWSAIKGALGLFKDVNKAEGVSDNQAPLPIDEYESTYSEEEITQLVGLWKKVYKQYYSEVEPSQTLSFEYWIGKQRSDDAETMNPNSSLVDNKLFEAIETFIPIATRANPDPLVQADPSEQGQALAHDIKAALVNEADRQLLRKKLKMMIRHWIIYRIAVAKVSYNILTEQIETEIINPKRMIFDKDGHINEKGKFTGEYIGEKKQATAGKLAKLFPKKAEYFKQQSQNKAGTKLEYIEWWYHGTDIFYTMDDMVLGKFKNPHWNYDGQGVEGVNHWLEPEAPYTFLSIFSTGLQPHDETSLVLQNISIQDMVNRRWRQLDKNIEGMNNGLVVSNVFTEAQASLAAAALRRGSAIRVPMGDVRQAVARFPAPALPEQVYEMLSDGRNEIRNIFGTSGSTPEGVDKQETVRGKILVNQLDSSRIGGGVTEYLEQVADTLYNNWVQFMFVHYTSEHFLITSGVENGAQLISIKNDRFPFVKTLNITVKEGSLIPKDPLTQRNEAIDLWSANAIDPRTLFKKLDFPDPNEATKQLILWQMVQKGQLPPQAYIPDFQLPAQVGAQGALPQQGVGGPIVNPIDASNQPQTPAPASPPAVASESKQLIQEIPV